MSTEPKGDPLDGELVDRQVKQYLRQLDGTITSVVVMLTGFSREKLEELGGFSDADRTD